MSDFQQEGFEDTLETQRKVILLQSEQQEKRARHSQHVVVVTVQGA